MTPFVRRAGVLHAEEVPLDAIAAEAGIDLQDVTTLVGQQLATQGGAAGAIGSMLGGFTLPGSN